MWNIGHLRHRDMTTSILEAVVDVVAIRDNVGWLRTRTRAQVLTMVKDHDFLSYQSPVAAETHRIAGAHWSSIGELIGPDRAARSASCSTSRWIIGMTSATGARNQS